MTKLREITFISQPLQTSLAHFFACMTCGATISDKQRDIHVEFHRTTLHISDLCSECHVAVPYTSAEKHQRIHNLFGSGDISPDDQVFMPPPPPPPPLFDPNQITSKNMS